MMKCYEWTLSYPPQGPFVIFQKHMLQTSRQFSFFILEEGSAVSGAWGRKHCTYEWGELATLTVVHGK
jgi:hypothetical protein